MLSPVTSLINDCIEVIVDVPAQPGQSAVMNTVPPLDRTVLNLLASAVDIDVLTLRSYICS